MCGIVGFFQPSGFNESDSTPILENMSRTLFHRGPDDAGTWMDGVRGIALAHRRLSIVDLSPAGHQPMVSESGRFVLVFNGEIYNHLHIRKCLEQSGHQTKWRGHSDTETLLAAIDLWGLDRALKQTVGMFALALWDRQDLTLELARDRIGEKPLYYGWQGNFLLFGSELKALRAHPAFNNQVDRLALPLYFRHGYIPAPWSIWRGIHKLPPGCWLRLCADHKHILPKPTPYWSMTSTVVQRQANPFIGTEVEAINGLEQLLLSSISGQQLADVPVGAFLSGGIDSTTVVAIMQAQSNRKVKTFTIGFAEAGYNEANHAMAVAKHLGTDHTELYVSAQASLDMIPRMPELYDEPFGDSSAIPTYLVSHLAREHVTVALSGDGGDELFGGYSRYSSFQSWHRRTKLLPSYARRTIATMLESSVPLLRSEQSRRRIAMLASVLQADTPAQRYLALNGHWLPVDELCRDTAEASYWFNNPVSNMLLNEPLDAPMLADAMTYLPDDILVKVDRAAMAVSLETRVPLLDHRLIEWAWSLPQRFKSRGAHHKWILRQLLYRYVPKELMERPKMGFGVPIGSWLRGPLREWAETLLSEQRIQQDGFLNSEAIQRKWQQHITGQHNWEYHLWDVLMFQAWLDSNKVYKVDV